MTSLRLLYLLIPPVLICGLLMSLVGRPYSVPTLEVRSVQVDCAAPPDFRVGYQVEEGAIQPQGDGFQLAGVSWLEADICGPGILNLQADGEVAAGEAPRLDVSLNFQLLARRSFDSSSTVKLKIPRAGRLILGYFNDYYASEVRLAVIENIRLRAKRCKDFAVKSTIGNTWSESARTLWLSTKQPVTLTPCASGQLSLRLAGQATTGQLPTVRFEQQEMLLGNFKASSYRQVIRLNVSEAPLTITLLNPHSRETADRNLNIRRIEFQPASP